MSEMLNKSPPHLRGRVRVGVQVFICHGITPILAFPLIGGRNNKTKYQCFFRGWHGRF
jgi:hypothetical protein